MPELGGGAAGSRRLRRAVRAVNACHNPPGTRQERLEGRLEYMRGTVGIPARSGWNTLVVCRERLEYLPGAVGIPAGSGWNTRLERLEYPLGAVGIPDRSR
eukprot:gene19692-biopygen20544